MRSGSEEIPEDPAPARPLVGLLNMIHRRFTRPVRDDQEEEEESGMMFFVIIID